MSKINIKSAVEIEAMREGGKILQAAHQAVRTAVKSGITLLDLDAIAEKTILDLGGVPAFKGFHGFPATICTMVNSEIVHGIPDDRVLNDGDILTIDCGVIYKKLITDAAFTIIVGGDETNPERARFSQTVKRALEAGCSEAIEGNTLGDIGYIIQKTVEEAGYSIIKEFTGHGVGHSMHEDPYVLNYGKQGKGLKLKAGMTICIEPIVARGKPKHKTLKDGWTEVTVDGKDACQWEYCGVVGKSGFEVFA